MTGDPSLFHRDSVIFSSSGRNRDFPFYLDKRSCVSILVDIVLSGLTLAIGVSERTKTTLLGDFNDRTNVCLAPLVHPDVSFAGSSRNRGLRGKVDGFLQKRRKEKNMLRLVNPVLLKNKEEESTSQLITDKQLCNRLITKLQSRRSKSREYTRRAVFCHHRHSG